MNQEFDRSEAAGYGTAAFLICLVVSTLIFLVCGVGWSCLAWGPMTAIVYCGMGILLGMVAAKIHGWAHAPLDEQEKKEEKKEEIDKRGWRVVGMVGGPLLVIPIMVLLCYGTFRRFL